MLLFALLIAIATTVVFALVPAIQASRADLTTALKEHERGSARQGHTLSVLVVTEVACRVPVAFRLGTASGRLRTDPEQTNGIYF